MSIREQSSNVLLEQELSRLNQEELRQTAAVLLSNSLLDFCREAWSVIEPEPFITSKYWQVFCEYLECVSMGAIKRLLINCPPRHGKSTLMNVLWPVWEWSRDGGKTKWIFCSSSESLAVRDSVKHTL